MSIINIFPALVTCVVCYLLIKLPVSISMPTDRGMHKNIIPSSGGIALLAGLSIIPFLFLSKFEEVFLISLILIDR